MVRVYTALVPAYLGGLMCFVCGGADCAVPRRADDIPDLRYYTPAIHAAAFQLPPYVESVIRKPPAQAEAS